MKVCAFVFFNFNLRSRIKKKIKRMKKVLEKLVGFEVNAFKQMLSQR